MDETVGTAARKTILVVEPDFGFACVTVRALRPHRVMLATTLGMAQEILEHSRVDVVVFDPETPDEPGIDFLVALTEFPDVRCVAYTMSAQAKRLGGFGTAHATLLKPSPDAELREAVLGRESAAEQRTVRRDRVG